VPADAQHPLPGDVFPGAPAHRASLTSTPFTPSTRTPDAFTDAPFPSDPVLDEILDWEMEALPRKEGPYWSYCEEGEPRDEEESLEESYILAAPGAPCPERFAVGGTADAMAPGPALAILADRVQRDGLDLLDDDQLTGVLQAANRLASWSVSLKLAATSRLAARREADGRKSGDWRPFDHVDDEVAVALTLTRRSGGRLVELALSLDRLPLTRAALVAGLIDERRAEIIAEELAGLDDEHAAAVEALIITKAPRLTSGQLRALVRRAVLSADPQAARKRKEAALTDARVEMFPETAGTAALSGRDLPPAAALAADKHLTALAQALQAAGIRGTLDTLRTRAYLHLLTGQAADTLILQTTHPGSPGRQPPHSPGAGTHVPPAPGSSASGGASPQPGPGPGGLPGLRGTVNLTMPLSAWLGWTQSPGDVPGYGPIDANDSRTLADLLAQDPGSQWCVTLTGRAGHPVAHACARHGPRPQPESPSPGTPAGPSTSPSPGTRAGPGTTTGPGDRHPDSRPARDQSPATGPPATTTPTTAPPPDWLRTLTFTTLQTRNCTHPRESRGYRPSPALRHLIQIRNPTCTAPGCRRAATRCDLDHVTSYDRGGRTCECNLGPACRHDHQCKQTPGWTLTTPSPGTLTWTTPGNRSYTTTPAQYPE
jgi:Domain of unknown function (DUF222)